MSNDQLYSSANCQLPEQLIKRARLRYFGHIYRMEAHRLPQLCLLQRYEGPRPSHGTNKRWRYLIQADVKDGNINLHDVICDRADWRNLSRDLVLERKPVRISPKIRSTEPEAHKCPYNDCNKICYSKIGLTSHINAHKKLELKTLICPHDDCSFRTTTEKRLQAHRLKHHQIPSEKIESKDKKNKTIFQRAVLVTCPFCGHTSTKSGTTRHKWQKFLR